jgi:tetratricopeptide (TPR) repeat protein
MNGFSRKKNGSLPQPRDGARRTCRIFKLIAQSTGFGDAHAMRGIWVRAAILGVLVMVARLAYAADTLSQPPVSSQAGDTPRLTILYPFNEALFPPEIAAPVFRWRTDPPSTNNWRIEIRFEDDLGPLQVIADKMLWSPDAKTWASIKSRSRQKPARMMICGVQSSNRQQPVLQAGIVFSTSVDEVGAPIFYRDVNLPFAEAVKDPSSIRWRFGAVSSSQPPPVVMEKLPVCGNCHSFTQSGDTLAMDVDYANSKGSYVITRVAPKMQLHPRDIITWDDFQPEDGALTYGLLSQVSPDGKFVISTVKDKSVFVPRPDLAFSQLFFPIKGILAYYDREARQFHALPGADDPLLVQSNPNWSPDGQHVVFARAQAYQLRESSSQGKLLLSPAECREFVSEGKPFRFDLYRIPFGNGQGGKAEPLAGACDNDRSNFFPRHSPDGRWIIFCQAKNYMLLQPDSELFIIPAQGGQARRLRCNLSRMNSWHSWSPNGKWLVFASKAFSDYTQLWLTHIDGQGESTPPVLLEQFTDANRAANIPEFVNLPPEGITKIEELFLDDYSYERAGNAFSRAGDADNAIRQYEKSLALNPTNAAVHQRMGLLLYHVKSQSQKGKGHLIEAIRLDPGNVAAHYDLARAYLHENQVDLAIDHLTRATRIPAQDLDPQYNPVTMRMDLAQALCLKNRFPEAEAILNEALGLNPNNARVHYLLAHVLVSRGLWKEPLRHYEQAIAIQPGIDRSPLLHDRWAMNYAKANMFSQAIVAAEKAWSFARSSGQASYAEEIKQRLDLYRQQTDKPGEFK